MNCLGMNLLYKCINRLFYLLTKPLSDKYYLRLRYLLIMKKSLHLKNPKAFTEKLQWLKLYDRKPIYSTLVDKYGVKDYVADKIGFEHVIPTIGIYEKYDDIIWDELPSQFVLKCTHDSGGVIVCMDKNSLNIKKVRAEITKRLKRNYYYRGREWPYKNVKPRIIIEKLLNHSTGELKDYKIYCFNGEPHCLFITKDRPYHTKLNFYDLSFKKLPINYVYPDYEDLDIMPACWDEMLKIARVLSQNIPFVRVDLYECDNIVYFGEMTFFPTGGLGKFNPIEWDYKFGEWLKLPTDERIY